MTVSVPPLVPAPDGGWIEKYFDLPRASAFASGRAYLVPARSDGDWQDGCRLFLYRGPFLIHTQRFSTLDRARLFAHQFNWQRREYR